MATRSLKTTHHNGNGNGNRRKTAMASEYKSSPTESIRKMIIRHFEGPPLRLNREDAERVADKMVKIAEKSREVTDRMKLP